MNSSAQVLNYTLNHNWTNLSTFAISELNNLPIINLSNLSSTVYIIHQEQEQYQHNFVQSLINQLYIYIMENEPQAGHPMIELFSGHSIGHMLGMTATFCFTLQFS